MTTVLDIAPSKPRPYPFSNKDARIKFTIKVFSLVAIMFLIATLFSILPFLDSENQWGLPYLLLFWFSLFTFLSTCIILTCLKKVRKDSPMNFISLALFTISGATVALFTVAAHKIYAVIICLAICLVVSLVVVLFTWKMQVELKGEMIFIFLLPIVLITAGVLAPIVILVLKWPYLHIVYGSAAAILHVAVLLDQIKKTMDDKEENLTPEHHVFGALQVFLGLAGCSCLCCKR